jgi:hypothetical protein
MPLQLGQAVVLRVGNYEYVGRICKIYATGFCCVQFEGNCARLLLESLEATDQDAPQCDETCSDGC